MRTSLAYPCCLHAETVATPTSQAALATDSANPGKEPASAYDCLLLIKLWSLTVLSCHPGSNSTSIPLPIPFEVGPCGSTPTSLGYQCSFTTPDAITIHWSNGTALPKNPCTQQGSGTPETSQNPPKNFMHFAAQVEIPEVRLHRQLQQGEASRIHHKRQHPWQQRQILGIWYRSKIWCAATGM